MNNEKYMKEPLFIFGIIFSFTTLTLLLILGVQFYQTLDLASSHSNHHSELVETENEYVLTEHATIYQEELFGLLETAAKAYDESPLENQAMTYASLVAQNFIVDFYTLSNKAGRYDVGGLQFIQKEITSDFHKKAMDTFYLYLDQYDEEQELDRLLSVTKINVESITESIYTLEDESTVTALDVVMHWEYDNQTFLPIENFMTDATVVLVEENGQYVVVGITEGGESIE